VNFDMPLKQTEINEFKSMLRRRLDYEPLQFILGKTSFYGYEIQLSNSVLIPRQETELLVEYFLNDLINKGNSLNRILEIGTGSGCISLAIANELKMKNINYQIKSIDISKEAIQIAEVNKINLKTENLDFEIKDVFSINDFNKFDYVVTNPPYISQEIYMNLDTEILKYEPEIALTDKSDGFTFFRHIFRALINTSSKCKMFSEIGSDQKNYLETLMKSLNLLNYHFLKDYSGLYRILILENR
jgi:release factor glutamine methyltransferase